MEEIIRQITTAKQIIKIDQSFTEIITNAEFRKGVPVKIFIKKVDDKILLTDNKHTLRFMNSLYELSAKDVKDCINIIVKNYGFKIDKGEIYTELKPNEDVVKRYNDLLICSATLANMLLFFDQPL